MSVYATGATANAQFDLLAARTTSTGVGCPEGDPVYPGVRTSNRRGFIDTTGGLITGSPGDYALCCYADPISPGGVVFVTVPVFFTIL